MEVKLLYFFCKLVTKFVVELHVDQEYEIWLREASKDEFYDLFCLFPREFKTSKRVMVSNWSRKKRPSIMLISLFQISPLLLQYSTFCLHHWHRNPSNGYPKKSRVQSWKPEKILLRTKQTSTTNLKNGISIIWLECQSELHLDCKLQMSRPSTSLSDWNWWVWERAIKNAVGYPSICSMRIMYTVPTNVNWRITTCGPKNLSPIYYFLLSTRNNVVLPQMPATISKRICKAYKHHTQN